MAAWDRLAAVCALPCGRACIAAMLAALLHHTLPPIVGYSQEVTASEAHRLQLNMPRSMLPAGLPACQGDHHATLPQRCHAMGLRGQVCSSILCVWHMRCRCMNSVELHHRWFQVQRTAVCQNRGGASPARVVLATLANSRQELESCTVALQRGGSAAPPIPRIMSNQWHASTGFKHPSPTLLRLLGEHGLVLKAPKAPSHSLLSVLCHQAPWGASETCPWSYGRWLGSDSSPRPTSSTALSPAPGTWPPWPKPASEAGAGGRGKLARRGGQLGGQEPGALLEGPGGLGGPLCGLQGPHRPCRPGWGRPWYSGPV